MQRDDENISLGATFASRVFNSSTQQQHSSWNFNIWFAPRNKWYHHHSTPVFLFRKMFNKILDFPMQCYLFHIVPLSCSTTFSIKTQSEKGFPCHLFLLRSLHSIEMISSVFSCVWCRIYTQSSVVKWSHHPLEFWTSYRASRTWTRRIHY